MKKGNMAFEETTRGVVNLLDLKENAELELSPLYRVQRLGNDFLQERFRDQGQLTYLPPKAMSSFRFELERGAVRESQDINSKLVVMTIGIAGGPFLGLLGTVWGVMETFAAMAMVGEANIMAIAPGVASALACTVVGLILAIPALFGYNYITTQIKNVMADVFLFIDRFAANVEENYGEKPEVLEHLDDRRAVR
jgi:biopolymer transport protein ExbB